MDGRQVAEEVYEMDDDRPFDDKALQFDRLWDGVTPKGVNRSRPSNSANTSLSMFDKCADHSTARTLAGTGWANFRKRSPTAITSENPVEVAPSRRPMNNPEANGETNVHNNPIRRMEPS